MPLACAHPVFVRLVLGGFDHAIGGDCGGAQAAAQIPDGLVMRSIDLHVECSVLIRVAGDGRKLSDFSAWVDSRGVYGVGGIGRQAFPAVLNLSVQLAGDVLVETAAEADVEALASIANGKNRLGGGEGVFDDGEIGFFSAQVGLVRFWSARPAVKRRMYVRGGTRASEGVQISHLCRELIWANVEGDV